MTPSRAFDEFLRSGSARKKTPDPHRAASLRTEAQRRKSFLIRLEKSSFLTDDDANQMIELIYDALACLARAKMIEEGYDAIGE